MVAVLLKFHLYFLAFVGHMFAAGVGIVPLGVSGIDTDYVEGA